jgi:hypothetical protein
MGAVMANALRKTVCSIAVPLLYFLTSAANAQTQIPQTFQTITNELDEFSDLGRFVFNAAVDTRDFHFLCTPAPTLARTANDFTVNAVVQNGPPDWSRNCQGVVAFDLGLLPAGRYTFTTNYTGAITTSKKLTIDVEESAKSCSSDPRNSELTVDHATRSAATMTEDLKDPVKRAALGNPIKVVVSPYDGGVNPFSKYPRSVLTYATPRNLLPIAQMLKREQGFQRAVRPLLNIPLVYCAGFYVASTRGTLIEYYNAALNHYFYTASAAEAAIIDNGGAGAGWVRTGEDVPVIIEPGCDTPRETADYEVLLRPTFRFYGTPGKGPNSHFFTVNRQECFAVTQDAGWQYELSPFWAAPPRDGGACTADTRPLYRLYNNRAAQNDSNHRFTTKQAIVDAMVGQGWVNEGTAMCVPK